MVSRTFYAQHSVTKNLLYSSIIEMQIQSSYCVYFVFSSHSFWTYIKFVGRTSRGHTGGRSHRISHPPSCWGVGIMCGGCLAYSTGVVLNSVGESAMPDSKENKQADAGSRRFRRHFLYGALLCNFLSTEHEGLSTHVQREWSAEPFMPSILSLRIFCTAVLSKFKFSPPTVCVLCFLPIHSGHTSSSLDVPAGVTQEEGHTGFLIHLLSGVL